MWIYSKVQLMRANFVTSRRLLDTRIIAIDHLTIEVFPVQNDLHLRKLTINIAPEKGPFEKESTLPSIIFQGRTVNFPGCFFHLERIDGATASSLGLSAGSSQIPTSWEFTNSFLNTTRGGHQPFPLKKTSTQ